MDEQFLALLAEINEGLDCDWTDKKMAERVGVSVSRFRTIFKKLTQEAPKDYLKQRRLQRAAQLVVDTREHFDQIAIRVGMSDPSHFTKDFKKHFNLTPTQYRRRHGQNRIAELLEQYPELKELPGISDLAKE